MSDDIFNTPDLTTFCQVGELGLEVTGSACNPTGPCWPAGRSNSTACATGVGSPGCHATPWSAAWHAPSWGGGPTTLAVRLHRYRCQAYRHVRRQDMSKAAEPRARLSRGGMRLALQGIVCQHFAVVRVAEGLGVSWATANDAILAEGKHVLIDDPHRLDGVRVVGVDEHVWRHTRKGDKYVIVIIDLTPIRGEDRPGEVAGHGACPRDGGAVRAPRPRLIPGAQQVPADRR